MDNEIEIPKFVGIQLGYLSRDINLYEFMDKTNLGKSAVGIEMDLAGRSLFNHRMGGGHLWWKELANRPRSQWGDILEHLASDLPTKQGIPYAFDASHIHDSRIISALRMKEMTSAGNWGMLNAFELVGGISSIAFAIYECKDSSTPYSNDMALATDFSFIALSVGTGIATCNPLLLIASVVKVGHMASRLLSNSFAGIDCHPGHFDLDCEQLLNFPRTPSVDVNALLGIRHMGIAW